MNPDLSRLQPYPFERIRMLLADCLPPADLAPIALSIGEPKGTAPDAVLQALSDSIRGMERYPTTRGGDALRQAVAEWLSRRYSLAATEQLASAHILPVNGTREALFAVAQCLVDRTATRRGVLVPNPFYQIYEGAALLAGAEPRFYAIDADADENIDRIDAASLDLSQFIYVCNPGNPTGSVLTEAAWHRLIERAHRHDFVIVSDECYSEIYREAAGPPTGLLQAASSFGDPGFARCLAFHSLSKRSNLPGLRSGFVAGDADLIDRFCTYRTYHGCSMPLPTQRASIVAWNDEQHVIDNRRRYDARFAAMAMRLSSKLNTRIPAGGFYLWPRLPENDELFTRRLFVEQHLRVVPGSYLARSVHGHNPGSRHIRLALVASLEECVEAAERLLGCLT